MQDVLGIHFLHFFFLIGDLKYGSRLEFTTVASFFNSEVAYFMARIYLDFILCHLTQLHKGNFPPTSQMSTVQGGCLIIQPR